jgi:hypothetical protein
MGVSNLRMFDGFLKFLLPRNQPRKLRKQIFPGTTFFRIPSSDISYDYKPFKLRDRRGTKLWVNPQPACSSTSALTLFKRSSDQEQRCSFLRLRKLPRLFWSGLKNHCPTMDPLHLINIAKVPKFQNVPIFWSLPVNFRTIPRHTETPLGRGSNRSSRMSPVESAIFSQCHRIGGHAFHRDPQRMVIFCHSLSFYNWGVAKPVVFTTFDLRIFLFQQLLPRNATGIVKMMHKPHSGGLLRLHHFFMVIVLIYLATWMKKPTKSPFFARFHPTCLLYKIVVLLWSPGSPRACRAAA